MFSSASKKDESKVVGVIDVGSAQVSGTIIKLRDRGVDSVLAEANKKISYQELPNFEHFWAVTQEAIKTVLQELKAGTKIEPAKIFIFLSSPFFQSQTKVIKTDNFNVTKITKNYLRDLINQTDQPISSRKNTVILEDEIMQTRLDGYLTAWPLGQKAKTVVVNRFLSWANKDLLIDLRDLVRAEYAKAPIFFNSFSFAVYSIFKDFLPAKDFILLDTGNEITDILIINDNSLAEHLSFPKGKNFLIRQLAKNLGTIPAEAENSLSLYIAGQANAQLRARLEPIIAKLTVLWQADFKQTLAKALETTFLPETIYLISDDPTDDIFVQFINQADLNEITLSNHQLDVVFVTKLLADGLTHLTGQSQPLTNSWLLAEALFCAKVD